MRPLLLLLLVTLSSVGVHAEEGPPPPPLLEDIDDPAELPSDDPREPVVVEPEPEPLVPVPPPPPPPPKKKQPPSDPPPAPPAPSGMGFDFSLGPGAGAVVGGIGGLAGAASGAVILIAAPELPEILSLLVIGSTPAMAALITGFLVVALIVPHPSMNDFTSVLACSAVGCAGTWILFALAAGGGMSGCNPGGCGSGDCGSCGSGGGDSSRGTLASAFAGIGALVGLGVGAAAIWFQTGASSSPPDELIKIGAAIGMVGGGLVGGAAGGFIVGLDPDDDFF